MRRVITFLLVALMTAWAAPASASQLLPGGTFSDDDGSVHEGYIEALARAGITSGCGDNRYCPDQPVTRGQMAAFLNRALPFPPGAGDTFTDDDDSEFESDIENLAASAVARGCNPPGNTLFCPEATVTRAQMAAFLVRAFGYVDGAGSDTFADDDGSEFEADIDRLAAAGVTLGCDPPDNTRFCPDQPVTRAEMATFLGRALDLTPDVPPPRAVVAVEVEVVDAKFLPNDPIISVGEGVVFTHHEGGSPHDVVWEDGAEGFGPPSSGEWAHIRVFDEPGTYAFYCSTHGAPGGIGMSGVVTVEP